MKSFLSRPLILASLALAACSTPGPSLAVPTPKPLPALSSPALPPSLTHRYSFTDNAKDSVGQVDGVLKGAAKIAGGGGKLILDNADKGSGDAALSYLEFSATPLPKTGSVSLACWFTCSEIPTFSRILDLGDREDVQGRAFIYFTPRTSTDMARAAITATDTASKTFIDSPRLDDGKEHLVVLVIDSTAKKLHIYVDGKEPEAAADLGDNTLDKVRPTHNWLGRSGFDQDGGFTGSINEFRVYNTALTQPDAEALAKAGPDIIPPIPAAK